MIDLNTAPALVARTAELDQLLRTLAPSGGSALVSSDRWCGATRLAREAVERLDEAGWLTSWVQATTTLASVPFGAVAHLLPDADGGAVDARLMHQTVARLHEQAGPRRCAVVVDDAELLDDASAALLGQAPDHGIGLIVVMHEEFRASDVARRLNLPDDHGLLHLACLDRSESEQLVRELLGPSVLSHTMDLLWHTAEGRPGLVTALVRGGYEEGRLRHEDGVWSWNGSTTVERVVALVEGRLAGITDLEEEALAAVALGQPLSLSVADAMGSTGALGELERKRLVVVHRDGSREQVCCARRVEQQVVLERITPLRMRAAAARLANAIEVAGGRRDEDKLGLARAALLLRRPIATPELLCAARLAGAAGEDDLAQSLASAALERGGGDQAVHVLAAALARSGRYASAADVLARHPSGSLDLELAALRFWALGEPPATDADPPRTSPAEQALATAMMVAGGDLSAVPRLSGRAEAEPSDRPQRLRVGLATALATAVGGQPEEAIAQLEVLTGGVPRRPFSIVPGPDEWLQAELVPLLLAGRLADVERRASAARAEALEGHDRAADGLCAVLIGRAYLDAGRRGLALDWLREGVAALQSHDRAGFLAWGLAMLARAAAEIGQVAVAERALERSQLAARPSLGLLAADRELSRAWVLAAQGRRADAGRVAAEVAEEAAGRGHGMLALLARHHRARIADAGGADPEVERLGASGAQADLLIEHIAALGARDPLALDRMSARFEERGMLVIAAEAAVTAAHHYDRDGHTEDARRSREKARHLHVVCGGSDLLAPASAGHGSPLTARQAEIAQLAASGLSNRQIAQRLFVGVRTVENHLQNVYARLGVHRREDLATVIGATRPGSRASDGPGGPLLADDR